jgi:hypothetical protein
MHSRLLLASSLVAFVGIAGPAVAQPSFVRVEAYKEFSQTTAHPQGNTTTYTTDKWTAPTNELKVREVASFAVLADAEGSCSYRLNFGDGTSYVSKGAELVDRFDIQTSGRVAKGYIPPPRYAKSYASPGVYDVSVAGFGSPACRGTATLRLFVGVEPTPTPEPPTVTAIGVPLTGFTGDPIKLTVQGHGTCSYKVTIVDGVFESAPGVLVPAQVAGPATVLGPANSAMAPAGGSATTSKGGAAAPLQASMAPKKASYSDRGPLPAVVPRRAVWKSPGSYKVSVESSDCRVVHAWIDPTSTMINISDRPQVHASGAAASAGLGGTLAHPTPTPTIPASKASAPRVPVR